MSKLKKDNRPAGLLLSRIYGIENDASHLSEMCLPCAVGRTGEGKVFMFDLAVSPHLLVAGTTGSGKTVFIKNVVYSLLKLKMPGEVKFVFIDPKRCEMDIFNKLPDCYFAEVSDGYGPVVSDIEDVTQILRNLCRLMDDRYDLLKLADVRNIVEYDAKWVDGQLNPADGHGHIPYIVVVIDEFADLLMIAEERFEEPVIKLAQLARAVGIHLIISTQRPTKSVITDGIKANFQCRAAFRMQRKADSNRVIDSPKAFSLSGPGEMLFYRYPDLQLVQCAMIEDDEIKLGINALL